MMEPKDVVQAGHDDNWLKVMHEELDQIKKNKKWELVPRPANKNVIGTKRIFRNKLNECGEVVRNKARLVCIGYAQIEDLDFDETLSHVSQLEVIRMFLEFVTFKKFKIYQMDVKYAFLNGELQEEVNIEQLYGFQLSDQLDYVFKFKKALYGLKQAPRAWYSKLNNYLLKCGFKRGAIDSNLYVKTDNGKLIVLVVYVDDIIFASD